MCYVQTEGIKTNKHFHESLGLYFMYGLGSDSNIVKGLNNSGN